MCIRDSFNLMFAIHLDLDMRRIMRLAQQRHFIDGKGGRLCAVSGNSFHPQRMDGRRFGILDSLDQLV